MIAFDTNILVRFFTNDDDKQYLLVQKLIESQNFSKNNIFISNIVLIELIWVLKKSYKASKNDIKNTVEFLLTCNTFRLEDYQLTHNAILKFKNQNGDFADYLIGNISNKYNATTTYTFDKKSAKDEFFTLLK